MEQTLGIKPGSVIILPFTVTFHAGLYLGDSRFIHMAPLDDEIQGKVFRFVNLKNFLMGTEAITVIEPKLNFMNDKELNERAR